MPLAALEIEETAEQKCTDIEVRSDVLPAVRSRPIDAEDLPSAERAEALERQKFIRMVLDECRRTGKGHQEGCLLVAVNYAEAFPILSRGGKGGSSRLTYNNFRNWIRLIGKTRDGEYDTANLAALCDNFVRGSQEIRTWNGNPLFWQAFFGFYMNRNRLAITTAYRLASSKTKKDNPFAVIPKLSCVQYRVAQLHPAEVALARHGEEALKTDFISHIDRDWDKIQPGFMLVADNRQFDVFVRVPGVKEGEWKAVRPWICAIIDARSWYMSTPIITTEPINNDTIANALGAFIHKENGNRPPLVFYVDNGKDFNAKGFSEDVIFDGFKHSMFIELGINTINSIPFNAKAKTVERYFKDVMAEFDKLFPAYLGSRPGERPDTAGYFQDNPEKLPSLDQFTKMFMAWLEKHQAVPKHGKIHKGKSPKEIWESRTPLAEPMSDARLFMAFLKPEPQLRTIDKGPSIRLNNKFYHSQELWPFFGKPVMVKTDRLDPEHAYAFQPDGSFICECRTKQAIPALATTDEDRRRIAEEMALQRHQLKNTYTAVNNLTGGWHVLSPAELLVAPPDVKIIRDGERKSVKGSNHKFVHYIAVGSDKGAGAQRHKEGEMQSSEKQATGNPEEIAENHVSREEKRTEELEKFQNTVLGNRPESAKPAEPDMAKFHQFMVTKKREEE